MQPAAEGTCIAFLGKVLQNSYPNIARPAAGENPNIKNCTTPKIAGTIEDYVSSATCDSKTASVVKRVLSNKVKQCPSCGKPNGYTLESCNACNHALRDVHVTTTPNVFSAFMLGIEKTPRFPCTVSTRYESERVLVFDDPLALTPLHFCAIPTTAYIPDWRFLLKRPAEGLQTIQALRKTCEDVSLTQFFSNKEWRSAVVRESGNGGVGQFDCAEHMLCGFNYPPSQYQLHIQYMSPMLLPLQHSMFLRSKHFTWRRFFPFEYVVKCLQALETGMSSQQGTQEFAALLHALDLHVCPSDSKRLERNATGAAKSGCDDGGDEEEPDEMPSIETIIDAFSKFAQIDYDSEHAKFLLRVGSLSSRFSNWRPECFEGTCVPFVMPGNGSASPKAAPQLWWLPFASAGADGSVMAQVIPEASVANADKAALQNYGRPPAPSEPNALYYAYPKSVNELDVW